MLVRSLSVRRTLARAAGAGGMAVVLGAGALSSTGTAAPLTPRSAAPSVASYATTLAGPALADFYPAGLAYDGNLNRVVLADTGMNRVLVYDATQQPPTLITTFGTVGQGNGQFQQPRDVAIDGQSNIYVVDAGNNRIEKFDENGNWLWTTGTPIGQTPGPSNLNTPIGISYSPRYNVLVVADTGNSLIRIYDTNGDLLSTSPAPATTGLSQPRDAVVGPDGRLWVTDYGHAEVKAYNIQHGNVNWTPVITLGDGLPNGQQPGELNYPYDVRFSPNGTIAYVADTGNDRVAEWSLSPSGTATFLTDTGVKCKGNCPAPPPGGNLTFTDLRRLDVDPSGNIWVADSWGSEVHEISPTGTSLQEFGTSAVPAPGFAQAYSVAVGPDGSTYVVDRLNQRVERFDANGNYLGSQGQRGVAAGDYSWPEGVAVGPDGTVWVADTRGNEIFHFPADLSGKPTVIGTTAHSRTAPAGTFNYIDGLTVDSSGNVWIADTGDNRIQEYNPTTATFTAFGKTGASVKGLARFRGPQGVAVTAQGVYVADTNHSRVVEMSFTGTVLAVSSSAIGLNQPEGLAAGPDGTIWVADTQNDRIVHLDANLNDLGDGFGSCGATATAPAWAVCLNGTSNLYLPHSLAVSGSTLYVADTYNNRVLEFSI